MHNLLDVKDSRAVIYLIGLLMIILAFWSYFASLSDVVRGWGRVSPITRNQMVQNLEGGIVKEILVSEGDLVENGQLVAVMDDTRFRIAYQELLDQEWALSIKLNRLESELKFETSFEPRFDFVDLAPEHVMSEKQLFTIHKKDLNERTSQAKASISLKQQEVNILRRMAKSGAVSKLDLLYAEQSLLDLESDLNAISTEFEKVISREYSEVLSRLTQVREQVRAREDQLRRTSIRSPINGIVNKVMATNIGGVVNPGQPLIEIHPLEGTLRVEGRIHPRDIGHIKLGTLANVKLTAYDFSEYGMLTGKVTHVGADTVVDEGRMDGYPYYEVIITLDDEELSSSDRSIKLRGGMQAEIELVVGSRKIIQHIFQPLY